MFRSLIADKDAYITDRVIAGNRVNNSNTGRAGSLDLFKLYGNTLSGSFPNVELSRLLIHFDLQTLRDLVSTGKIDLNHSSFNCTLKLFDVYGGQPNPDNFGVVVYPLSRSFDEGHGRDVVTYSDYDVCNFLTASRAGGVWFASGCNLGGLATDSVDFITSASIGGHLTSLLSSQQFIDGTEDLSINVTTAISATLIGAIPDNGFRISLSPSLENNVYTYFVKRFAGRGAYNAAKRPALYVKFDDSVIDDSLDLEFDASGSLFLYNYAANQPANLMSGSSPITGSGCLALRLVTEISGGYYTAVFTGSQHKIGQTNVVGLYSASVFLDSQVPQLALKIAQSGSVNFTPIWSSLDSTVSFLTGSTLSVASPNRGNFNLSPKRYTVSITEINKSYKQTDGSTTLRVNIFDQSAPVTQIFKIPTTTPGIVLRDSHFSVRDAISNVVIIPFDTTYNSTRLSGDGLGMYFTLDVLSLPAGSYEIDISLNVGGTSQLYQSAAPTFKVVES